MQVSEVLDFLSPIGDVLSTFFVFTLIILTIATLISLLLWAKASNWEKNWYGGDLEDSKNNLADDHGSVHELSEAVATKAEKVADIMPSMLLIVGLLGTFIGLGIALNKASIVLAMADASGMDSAMTQLMGLMDGLGAKFKTSTWGILCFIFLNVVFNILGFKEKRLAWAIRKVRQESDARNSDLSEKELQRHQSLIDILESINFNAKHQSMEVVESIRSLSENNHKTIKNFKTEISKLTENQTLILQNLSKQHSIHQTESLLILGQIRNDFNKNSTSLIEKIEKNRQRSADENKALFAEIKTSLDENNDISIKNALDNIHELKKISEYNQATQKSMQDFVDKTVGSMESIGESANSMAKAASAVGESALGLENVVSNLQDELEGVMSMIKRDLSQTISDMGTSFEDNMTEMSKSMSDATVGISNAVDDLSKSVDSTMQEVTSVIGESMELQRKSGNEFAVTSESLNGQILEMTDLIQQLSGDITSGLKAVSENGRRMVALDKRYNKYSELIENITQTNQKLLQDNESISANLTQISVSTPSLVQKVENTLSESLDIQQEYKGIFHRLAKNIEDVCETITQNQNKLIEFELRQHEMIEQLNQNHQSFVNRLDNIEKY